MKNKAIILSFIVISDLLFISAKGIAQDWKWALSGKGTSCQTELLTTDKFNNSYFAVYYNDSLTVGDQSYYHYQWYYNYNCLLLKLDKNGKLLNQIDFYSPSNAGGSMLGMKAAADSSGNIYVGGEFRVRVFIGDTVVNHLPLPEYEAPSTYLVKFDSNFDMKWAKVMGCEHYVYFMNMAIRNNQIYYSVTPHSWYSPNPYITLYCFGQDTLYFPKTTDYSVYFYLDFDGNIVSHTTFHGNAWISDEIIAENNDRFLVGMVHDTLFFENKAIYYLDTPGYWEQFILRFNSSDSLIGTSSIKTSNHSYLPIVTANSKNELFFQINTPEQIAIGNDTIPSEYVGTNIIGKLDDQRNISWFESLGGINDGTGIHMAQMHDTLYMASAISYFLFLSDTVINNPGGLLENYILCFDPYGSMFQYYYSNTTGDSHTTDLAFDNCENIVLSGTFQGKAYYGNDTLISYSEEGNSDLFIAYLSNAKKDINLGPDTIVCGKFKIHGPVGFDHYSWNNGVGNQKDLLVTETGKYILTAWTDECCSLEDSVNVTILRIPVADLGNDTTLKQSQTLQLSVPAGFDKYIWSTGAETNTIILEGYQLAVGLHTIWCEITNNNCTNVDTLLLEVINDYGINEFPEIDITVKPNPFNEKFTISCKKPIKDLQIFDYSGKLLANFTTSQDVAQPILITMPFAGNNLLLLKLRTDDGIYYRKVLQLHSDK